ncbi:MAG: hypothetical protein GY778_04550 [bacterium]|nr:hypothetical protein [bacterium]
MQSTVHNNSGSGFAEAKRLGRGTALSGWIGLQIVSGLLLLVLLVITALPQR